MKQQKLAALLTLVLTLGCEMAPSTTEETKAPGFEEGADLASMGKQLRGVWINPYCNWDLSKSYMMRTRLDFCDGKHVLNGSYIYQDAPCREPLGHLYLPLSFQSSHVPGHRDAIELKSVLGDTILGTLRGRPYIKQVNRNVSTDAALLLALGLSWESGLELRVRGDHLYVTIAVGLAPIHYIRTGEEPKCLPESAYPSIP